MWAPLSSRCNSPAFFPHRAPYEISLVVSIKFGFYFINLFSLVVIAQNFFWEVSKCCIYPNQMRVSKQNLSWSYLYVVNKFMFIRCMVFWLFINNNNFILHIIFFNCVWNSNELLITTISFAILFFQFLNVCTYIWIKLILICSLLKLKGVLCNGEDLGFFHYCARFNSH